MIHDQVRFSERMANHRGYVNRQWQYFAAYLILNGFLINATKDFYTTRPSLVVALGISSLITAAVFLHLINWARMRISRNSKEIEILSRRKTIEMPEHFYEGITFWLNVPVIVFSISWFYWLFEYSLKSFLIAGGAFGLIVILSLRSIFCWSQRPLNEIQNCSSRCTEFSSIPEHGK